MYMLRFLMRFMPATQVKPMRFPCRRKKRTHVNDALTQAFHAMMYYWYLFSQEAKNATEKSHE